jgi:peptidyl-prolyl cis-trans isomerase SurA
LVGGGRVARRGRAGGIILLAGPDQIIDFAALDRAGAVVTILSLMKIFRFILIASIFAPIFSRADVLDGVKAVVSDRAITYAEVEDFTRPAQEALRHEYAAQPDVFEQKYNAALNDSLEQLVERQLILHEYDTGSYTPLPDRFVDQLVQDRIRERFGDRVTLVKTLQAQGVTMEQFRKQVRDQYVESAMRNQNVQREIIISPFKVENYFQAHQSDFKVEEQIKLRMIVLNKSDADDTNTLKLAHEIAAKIKDGATFSEMASVYSQGSQQHQGGDWGWVERSVLRPELADVAFKLPPGQTSDVIDTPDACYLMFVEDKKAAHVRPLADVRDEIEKTLRAQLQARLEKQWIDGLRKKTYVQYF